MVMPPQVSWLFFKARAKRPYLNRPKANLAYAWFRKRKFRLISRHAFPFGKLPVDFPHGSQGTRHEYSRTMWV
jgi:hypothetical protein